MLVATLCFGPASLVVDYSSVLCHADVRHMILTAVLLCATLCCVPLRLSSGYVAALQRFAVSCCYQAHHPTTVLLLAGVEAGCDEWC